MIPTIMLTGLAGGYYKHENVAKLVWQYFPKQDLQSLYYNVLVLTLQRRVRSHKLHTDTGRNSDVITRLLVKMELSLIISSPSPPGFRVFPWLVNMLPVCPGSHQKPAHCQRLQAQRPLRPAAHELRTQRGMNILTGLHVPVTLSGWDGKSTFRSRDESRGIYLLFYHHFIDSLYSK